MSTTSPHNQPVSRGGDDFATACHSCEALNADARSNQHSPWGRRYFRTGIALLGLLSALSIAGCGQESLNGAPNVVGLTLPSAEQTLQNAGYTDSVKTDALFGVIIPDHFTVCTEHSPVGQAVPLDVSKQC
jgi:hypothetical protein